MAFSGETILFPDGVEHAALTYNDDTGSGLTYCRKVIGPSDIGPRMEEPVTCQDCIKVIDKDPKKILDELAAEAQRLKLGY